MADNKIGCYLCSGCGIGEAMDLSALEELATDDCAASLAKTHQALCEPEGLELIKKDIADEGVNVAIMRGNLLGFLVPVAHAHEIFTAAGKPKKLTLQPGGLAAEASHQP